MIFGLTGRQKEILRAIIDIYVEMAEPVGSRILSKYFSSNLSSATIRNEMAELEESGLLKQPHISAGRVPSDSGYRLFVDQLMGTLLLSEDEKNSIVEYQKAALGNIELILMQTAKILAILSNCISMVQTPQKQHNFIKHIQLIPINSKEVMVFIVTNNSMVYHYLVKLKQEIYEESLNLLVKYLNEKLRGSPLQNILFTLNNPIESEVQIYIDFIRKLASCLKGFTNLESKIYLSGTSNVLKEPEFKDHEKVCSLINFCEQQEKINDLLNSVFFNKEPMLEEDIAIYIGSENPYSQLYNCTMVISSYFIGDKAMGMLGVVGPTRMQYAKVSATVQTVAMHLSRTLTELYG